MTGAAFLLAGHPMAAAGCIAPDAGLLFTELPLRRSGVAPEIYFEHLAPAHYLIPYRILHSFIFVLLMLLIGALLHHLWMIQFGAGFIVHLTCDLPTHTGRIGPRPFYPFSFRWKHGYGCPAEWRD